jgi:hypothetical protein
MLRTLADSRSARVGTALAIETLLAVKASSTPISARRRARRRGQTGCVASPCWWRASSTPRCRGAACVGAAERAAPHRLERARARARARGRHALNELGGGGATRERARRVLVLGVDTAELGREPESAAPARCAAYVLMQRRFVGRAETLVQVEKELTKTRAGGREEIGYDGGEEVRCLERGEARP